MANSLGLDADCVITPEIPASMMFQIKKSMKKSFTKGLDAIFWTTLFLFILNGVHQSAETRELIDSENSIIIEESTQAQGVLQKSIHQMLINQKLLNSQITRLLEYQQSKTDIENLDQKGDEEHPPLTSPINDSHEEDEPQQTEIKDKEKRLDAYTDADLKDLKFGIFEQKLKRFELSLTDTDLDELELRTHLLLDRFLNDALSSGNPLPEGVSLDFLQKDESSLLPNEKFVRDQIIESMRKSALVEMQTEEATRIELKRIEEMELEFDEQDQKLPK